MQGMPPKRHKAHYEDDFVQEHTYSPGWKLVVAATIAVVASIVFLLNFAMEYSEKKLQCQTEGECTQLFLKGLSLLVAMIVAIPLSIWI